MMDEKVIKTGTTALYKQNFISYSPKHDHLEMIFGTNTKKYRNCKITLQKKETIDIGTVEIDGELYYCAERLFIELNKFDLESTIKAEAKKKLLDYIDPEKTKKLYEKLKTKRRNLDKYAIENYLNKNLLYIKEKLKEIKDKKMLLKEYIMALVSRNDIPVSLIKGGSSIELFTTISRATLDIDTHADKASITNILDFLLDKTRDIYFNLSSQKERNVLADIKKGKETKRVIKFNLVPISRGGSLKDELKDIYIQVSFNTTYSQEEIVDIIKTYKITHRNLKFLSNATCIVFTREMLLAEKFQSIISKPTISTRTKDLIDLKLLWSDDINFNLFRKWLFRKWSGQSHPLDKENAKKTIKKNKNKDLTKIHKNYKEAIGMYGMVVSYEECIFIYNTLINESLK